MKNWTIGRRIVAGGAILLGLLIAVGGVAIYALNQVGQIGRTGLQQDAIPALNTAANLTVYFFRGQVWSLTSGSTNDPAVRQKALVSVTDLKGKLADTVEAYQNTITSAENRAAFEKLRQKHNDYVRIQDEYLQLVKSNKEEEADKFLPKFQAAYTGYRDEIVPLLQWNQAYASSMADKMVAKSDRSTHIAVVVIAVSIVAAVILGAFIIGGVSRALKQIADSLNAASRQVSSAAAQVSASSQSLAEGSSEQAASLEETSASLEEIGSMTKRNAESAENARTIASETSEATEAGTRQMGEMVGAMQAIKISSDNIAKIIKTIDEIAFQTNILALNAAVEAARAGEAGAGFAVVAEEVRALAQRAAQAAKETAEKIDDTIKKSGQGVQISGKVANDLQLITTKTRRVNELVVEIASASKEQTQGLGQVTTAVSQMDKVTQNNAGNAEETASSAQELDALALTLITSVGELLQLVGGSGDPQDVPSDHTQVARKKSGANPVSFGRAKPGESRNRLTRAEAPASPVGA